MQGPPIRANRKGFLVHMPDELRDWLRDRAGRNMRSQHSELLMILVCAMQADKLKDASDQGFAILAEAEKEAG